MRSEKAMSYKMLSIYIVIIIIIALVIMLIVNNTIKNEQLQTNKTNMLLIQAKVKVLSQESVVQKNEELLKGEKLSDKTEDEKVKMLIENDVINTEDKSFSKYYIWNNEILNEFGLTDIDLKEGFYIINYDTYEVIYTEGIKIDNEIYYKLSEIEDFEKNNEKDNEEVNDIQENNEHQN